MAGQINAPIGRPRSRDVLPEHFFKKLLLENVRKTGMKQSHEEVCDLRRHSLGATVSAPSMRMASPRLP